MAADDDDDDVANDYQTDESDSYDGGGCDRVGGLRESPEALGLKVWAALGAVKVEQAPGAGFLGFRV